MPGFDAGFASARYELNTSQFERAIDAAIRRYDDLAKAAATATARSSLPAPTLPQPATPQPRAVPTNTPALLAEQRALASLEAAQARLARTQGDVVQAARLEEQAIGRLSTALQRTDINTRETIALQRQLTTVQQQAARAAQGGGVGAVTGLRQAAGALGIGLAASQVAQFAQAAGQEALALRETQNTLRALSGDTATYNHIIEVARRQQVLFGGSLRDNLEGLQGLAITARSSGAELETLIGLSERLSILDPAQGTQGARIALSEALSGDPRSLALRYEIPRQSLAKLTDASATTSDRLQVLDDYLTKIGISSELTGTRVDKDAAAFRTLAQALGDATTAMGDFLATQTAPIASGLAAGIERVTQGVREGGAAGAIASLIPSFDEIQVKANVAADAIQKVREAGSGSFFVGAGIPEAIAGLQAVGDQTRLNAEATRLAEESGRRIGESSEAYGAQLLHLAQQLDTNVITTEQYNQKLIELQRAHEGLVNPAQAAAQAEQLAAQARQEAAQAAEAETAKLAETISTQQDAAIADQEATDIKNALEGAAYRVAAGMSTQAAEVARLIADYPALADLADGLIGKQIALANAANLAADAIRRQQLAEQKEQTRSTGTGKGGGTFGVGVDAPGTRGNTLADFDREIAGRAAAEEEKRRLIRETGDYAQVVALDQLEIQEAIDKHGANSAEAARARAQLARDQQQQAIDKQAALNNQIQQTGTEAQKVALAQKQYNDAVKQFGKDSVQAINAQTELTAAQQHADEAAKRGARGGTSAANKGLSALQQDEIQAQETAQGQLDVINRLLATGNLTQHQRNDLLEKQRKLEAQITDEKRAQQRAALDAAQAANDDAQKRLVEAREVRGLQNQAVNARASEEERAAARLRLEEIALDQQQRAADIEEKRRKAGGVPIPETAAPAVSPEQTQTQQDALAEQRRLNEQQQRQLAEQQRLAQAPIPGVTAPLPLTLPDLTQLPPIQLPTLQAPPVTVNLSITLDKDGNVIRDQVDPGAILRILGTQSVAQNLMGGR